MNERKIIVTGIAILLFLFAAGSSPADGASEGGEIFVNSGQGLGGETGYGVALGDLDGDGDVDAFVANDYTPPNEANQVWVNQGNGVFSMGQTLGAANGYAVALGDLDGDGDLDAMVAGLAPTSAGTAERAGSLPPGPGTTRVWLNQGGAQGGTPGEFAAGVSFGAFSSYAVALADVDIDGDLDALVAGNSNQVWLNQGNGAFAAGHTFPYQFSSAVALSDLDADGYPDAVIGDSASGPASRVWWNDGNWSPGPGTFTPGPLLPVGNLVHALAAGDLDGDGRTDLFLASSGPDQLFWNEGGRTFSTAGPLPVSDNSWGLALADVDGDDDLDAVVANITAEPNRLWRNDGGRLFTIAQEFGDEFGNYWSRGAALSDLNDDGSADLFEVTTAEDRVWFNQSIPPTVPNEEGWQVQVLDARGTAGFSPDVALDAAGHPHISYGRLFQDPDETVTYLHYARWDGVRWHREFVANSASETAIALDGAGRPHIAYTTGPGSSLRYTVWDGAAWQVRTVDEVPFPHTLALGSLALDASGRAHIVYNTFSNTSGDPELLKVAHWNGTDWQIQTVESGLVYDSALALDGAGTTHLSYAIREGFDQYVLKYAFWNGSAWQSEIVDGEVQDGGVFVTSLALDGAGAPHIGYVLDDFNSGGLVRYAARNGGSWQVQTVYTIDPDHSVQDISVDVGSDAIPHLVYYLSDPPDGGHWIERSFWDGASWQRETLDGGATTTNFRDQLVAMALDGAGTLHAAYYATDFEDLRYVTWAPHWQLRTVPEGGNVTVPSVAVARTIPSVGYYRPGSGQVKLASWDLGWTLNPVDFVGEPVTDLSVAAGPQFEHVSYYDADNQRLMYSYWDGVSWTFEVVDEAGDVGRYNALLLAGDSDSPRVAYWDDTTLRVKLALPVPGSVLWTIYPNNAGPALDSSSGPLSAAPVPGGTAVSYYDGGRGDLRLARWSAATGAWTDERIDGAAGDVGRLNALQTDMSEEVPVVAYYDESNDAIRYGYRSAAGWQLQTVVPGAGGVTSLALELGLDSRHRARIAYTTGSGELKVALLRGGLWQVETVESGAAAVSEVSLARDSRLHLAYVHGGRGLQYAFRTATLDVNAANPAAPPSPTGGEYNPLDPCPDDPSPGGQRAPHHSGFAFPAAPFGPGETLDDPEVFDIMTNLFRASAAGRQYVDLYHQHAPEMGRIGLADPALLWDAYGTLQNFMPGLEALVSGRGDEMIVTQEMVDDALSVWQRLAAAAGPGLAGAIDTRLAQYHDLQDFVGLTFDEWAGAIGVEPPPARLFLPLIQKGG